MRLSILKKVRQVKSNPQLIVASPPAGYQPFNPFFYSLESFLPLVKLHQKDYWLANAALKRKWGTGLRYLDQHSCRVVF